MVATPILIQNVRRFRCLQLDSLSLIMATLHSCERGRMPPDQSFDDLMVQLRRSNQDAATELFDRFTNRLIALARTRLRSLPPQKEDPEDVANSALKSFFVRFRDDEFELNSWDGLWGLLARITLRKCGHRIEYHRAACRDVYRELSSQPAAGDESATFFEAIARDPSPSEAAVAVETVEGLMRPLEQRDREILALALQGFSSPEVSAQVGCTERTVRRVLERIRNRLEKMRTEDAAES